MSRERIVIITSPPPQPLTQSMEHGDVTQGQVDVIFTGGSSPNVCIGAEFDGTPTTQQLGQIEAILLQAVEDIGGVMS